MRIPTVDELREELAAVERRLAELAARSDFDPDMDFALKTEIGGIRSESRRTKERRRDRWDREAAETVELARRKADLESRIAARESHIVRREEVEAAMAAVMRAMLKPGDQVRAGDYQATATVTRVNAKTVSFRLPSGFADRLPFTEIRPLEWSRMAADYHQAHAGTEER